MPLNLLYLHKFIAYMHHCLATQRFGKKEIVCSKVSIFLPDTAFI
jgi:hypothetical protein